MRSVFKLILCLFLTWAILNSCKKEYSCENCNKANRSPIANAGRDTIIFLPVDFVVLDGSASTDQDGTITSYQWTLIKGPTISNITKPAQSISAAKSLAVGDYSFELTVTDNGGSNAKDTVTVSVKASCNNQPPVAIAGNDEIRTLNSQNIKLDGSNSFDPDGIIISYEWTKISGPSVTIITPGLSTSSLTNYTEGDYLFKLTVTDSSGASSNDTVGLSIIKNNLSGYEYSFNTEWGFNDIGTDYDVYTGTNGPNADLFVNDSVLFEAYIMPETSSVWIPVPKLSNDPTISQVYYYFIRDHVLFIFAFFPGSAQLIGKPVAVKIKFL